MSDTDAVQILTNVDLLDTASAAGIAAQTPLGIAATDHSAGSEQTLAPRAGLIPTSNGRTAFAPRIERIGQASERDDPTPIGALLFRVVAVRKPLCSRQREIRHVLPGRQRTNVGLSSQIRRLSVDRHDSCVYALCLRFRL